MPVSTSGSPVPPVVLTPARDVRAIGTRDLFGLDVIDRMILAKISNGRTNTEISREMSMPVATLQNRICRAMRKLGAANRAHLAATYVRRYEGIEP